MDDSPIFIDTGAYFAHFYRKDQHHQEALELWQQIEEADISKITTNHVLDEVATLLARKTNYSFAVLKLNEVYNSEIQIYRPGHQDELEALKLLEKYADQEVSFTDCLSFATMNRLNIEQAFTFDLHFSFAGFKAIALQR